MPGRMCAWIIGNSVAAFRCCTISTYPKAGTLDTSTIPNTHTSCCGRRPRWYYTVSKSTLGSSVHCLYYVNMYLRFMTKKTFVDLNSDILPSKRDRCLQEFCAADLTQPLINITCCALFDAHILSYSCNWVFPSPKIQQKEPLLQSNVGFLKETRLPDALSCFAACTPPTNSITHVTSRPLLHCHCTTAAVLLHS